MHQGNKSNNLLDSYRGGGEASNRLSDTRSSISFRLSTILSGLCLRLCSVAIRFLSDSTYKSRGSLLSLDVLFMDGGGGARRLSSKRICCLFSSNLSRSSFSLSSFCRSRSSRSKSALSCSIRSLSRLNFSLSLSKRKASSRCLRSVSRWRSISSLLLRSSSLNIRSLSRNLCRSRSSWKIKNFVFCVFCPCYWWFHLKSKSIGDIYSDFSKCENIIAFASLTASRSTMRAMISVPSTNSLFFSSSSLTLRFLASRFCRSGIGFFRRIFLFVLYFDFRLQFGAFIFVIRFFC